MNLPQIGVGGAALLSTVGNALFQGFANRRSRRFSNDMYDRQRQDFLADRDFALYYQSPKQQMARLEAAGLNPNLVYGSGVQAQTAPGVDKPSIPTPNFRAPNVDLGSVVSSALQFQQAKSNISLTEAQADLTRMRSKEGAFDLAVKELIGGDNMKARYLDESAKLKASASKEVAEYDLWFSALFDSPDTIGSVATDRFNRQYTIAPNNPARAAIRANMARTIVDLDNARKDGDIKSAITAIRKFEANLADQGYSPNSPWYIKIVGTLLQRYGILDIGDLDKITP